MLRDELAHRVTLLRLPAGSTLFRERDACAGFPMVLSGRVRISRVLADGRELVLYDVGPGESCVLSTSGLLGNARYNALAGLARDSLRARCRRAFGSPPRTSFACVAEDRPPAAEAVRGFTATGFARSRRDTI